MSQPRETTEKRIEVLYKQLNDVLVYMGGMALDAPRAEIKARLESLLVAVNDPEYREGIDELNDEGLKEYELILRELFLIMTMGRRAEFYYNNIPDYPEFMAEPEERAPGAPSFQIIEAGGQRESEPRQRWQENNPVNNSDEMIQLEANVRERIRPRTTAEETAFRDGIQPGLAAMTDRLYYETIDAWLEANARMDQTRTEINRILSDLRNSDSLMRGTVQREFLRTGLNVLNFAVTKDPMALQSLEHDIRESIGDFMDERAHFNNRRAALLRALMEYDVLKSRMDHLFSIHHAERKRRFNHGLPPFNMLR